MWRFRTGREPVARDPADPFGAALRWGFEAAAAREAEMRQDREAALTDIMDAEAARELGRNAAAEYRGYGRQHPNRWYRRVLF